MWQERRRAEAGYIPKTFSSKEIDCGAQRDRARIVHSASFRRLQAKTQVLDVGEHDFYRTRLTHSLEVAQIGSGVCEHLLASKCQTNEEYAQWIPSLCQIEAICLCHDIGHPPFGHGGEIALNYYMKDYGGFEGNGQTIRIAAKLGEYSPAHGLDLTRRSMLGLLKYPTMHATVAQYTNISKNNLSDAKPPKCIHDDEHEVLEWILRPLHIQERQLFSTVNTQSNGHSKSQYKSFDCSIMELADDIAYGVHDFEDAVAMQLVTYRQWTQEVVARLNTNNLLYKNIDFFNDALFSENDKIRKHAISRLVGYFITNIDIAVQQQFTTPLLRLQAAMDADAYATLCLLKNFIVAHVINTPAVQAQEYKGQHMTLRLFEVFAENTELLPTLMLEQYRASENAPRVICDFISSMTNSNAIRQYKKLFTPDVGSIFDRF